MPKFTLPEGAKEFNSQTVISGDDSTVEWVDVPQWGGGCFVKNLSSAQRDEWEIACSSKKGSKGYLRAMLVQWAAIDADGNQKFGPHQVPMLARKNAAAVDLIAETILRISGMRKEDAEQIEKNLPAGPAGDSGCSSPSTSVSTEA